MTIFYAGEENLTPEQLGQIEAAVAMVLQVEGLQQPGEVSISLVSEDEIHELNLEYRGKDQPTDVLSFPQLDSLEEARTMKYLFLGDIVISLTQVARQAEEYGHSEARELSYLTVHSLYHLLGFDHETDDDKAEMRSKEKKIMQMLEEL